MFQTKQKRCLDYCGKESFEFDMACSLLTIGHWNFSKCCVSRSILEDVTGRMGKRHVLLQPTKGSGSCSEFSQWGLGGAPTRIRFDVFLTPKSGCRCELMCLLSMKSGTLRVYRLKRWCSFVRVCRIGLGTSSDSCCIGVR